MSDCNDCEKDVIEIKEYFMLKNEVWFEIARIDEFLCLGCAEKRLGRRLVPEDFADCLINKMKEIQSSELRKRHLEHYNDSTPLLDG